MNRITTLLLGLFFVSLFAGVAPLHALAQDTGLTPEEQLAEMYVPVAYLKEQERQCGVSPDEGEPYLPLPVELLLGNERVLIRDASTHEVLASGPTAQELATFGRDTYMDFPGDPRKPGCTYETDERARTAEEGLVPTVYANVIFDEEGGRLALQYWFYWYFNDWNNTHESDWEGIQLQWDEVSSVEEAVQIPPSRIGYSQHGNGELANWGDNKVQLEDGTHPLVFPAAGSHATFFSNDVFLAWGERSSGFGCDISAPPSERVPLDVIVVPNEIDPEGEFAWLLYEGRWGEQQRGAFNGPRGPMMNDRWVNPWDTFETWRPFSIIVPGSRALGPSMTEAFCGLTASGSGLLLRAMTQPLLILPSVAIVIGALAYFSRKSWPTLRRARILYQENWKLFFGIGLVSLPIGIFFNVLQQWLIVRQPLRWLVDWLDNTGGARLTAVMAVGGIQQVAMLLLITPALVYAVHEVVAGRKISFTDAYKGILGRSGGIAIGFIIFLAVIVLLSLTTIGLPIAVWLAVKWHFFVQVMIFDREARPAVAFTESSRVVRGKWWTTLFALLVYDLMAVIPGILVGFGLLTIGRTAVGFANSISSILYAVLMPLSVIAVTLLFIERRENAEPEEIAEPAPVLDPAVVPGNA